MQPEDDHVGLQAAVAKEVSHCKRASESSKPDHGQGSLMAAALNEMQASIR